MVCKLLRLDGDYGKTAGQHFMLDSLETIRRINDDQLLDDAQP